MPWMYRLKEINPDFKATLFSVPGLGSRDFWKSHPEWIEIAWHGHYHPTPVECLHWDREQMERLLDDPIMDCRTTDGWKSPGWCTSPAIYEVLRERSWWIADQHIADAARPSDMRVYLWEDGSNWHGHVDDVCGNGLNETWAVVCEKVRNTEEFLFASEAVKVPA